MVTSIALSSDEEISGFVLWKLLKPIDEKGVRVIRRTKCLSKKSLPRPVIPRITRLPLHIYQQHQVIFKVFENESINLNTPKQTIISYISPLFQAYLLRNTVSPLELTLKGPNS